MNHGFIEGGNMNLIKNILTSIFVGTIVTSSLSLMLCFALIFGIIGIWVWPYAINSWLVFYGKSPSIVWWQGFLLGVYSPLGKIGILAAIVTWIAMMFLR